MQKYNSSSCPVPLEQQPIYEYENLKNSLVFFWTTENLPSYFKSIVRLITLNYIIVGGFAVISDNFSFKLNLENALFISSIVGTLILLLFFRIYLGWEYIYNRLKNATISYEESGWYDGQIWIKTPDILIKDRLTADYILFPIIRRIKITLCILSTYLLFIFLFNTFS